MTRSPAFSREMAAARGIDAERLTYGVALDAWPPLHPDWSPRFEEPLPIQGHSVDDVVRRIVDDGLTPVAITSEWEAIQLVSDPLPRTIARIALPAVASSLLMTLTICAISERATERERTSPIS